MTDALGLYCALAGCTMLLFAATGFVRNWAKHGVRTALWVGAAEAAVGAALLAVGVLL